MLKGSCVCGTVRVEVEDAFLYAGYCHCSRCRKRTGSAFSTYAGIEAGKLHATAGGDAIRRVAETPGIDHHAFCSHCHAWLYSILDGGRRAHVRLGILDDTPARRPDHHIYVGSKAPWHEIADALPQFDTLPP